MSEEVRFRAMFDIIYIQLLNPTINIEFWSESQFERLRYLTKTLNARGIVDSEKSAEDIMLEDSRTDESSVKSKQAGYLAIRESIEYSALERAYFIDKNLNPEKFRRACQALSLSNENVESTQAIRFRLIPYTSEKKLS